MEASGQALPQVQWPECERTAACTGSSSGFGEKRTDLKVPEELGLIGLDG